MFTRIDFIHYHSFIHSFIHADRGDRDAGLDDVWTEQCRCGARSRSVVADAENTSEDSQQFLEELQQV